MTRVATVHTSDIGPISTYTKEDPEDLAVTLNSQRFVRIGNLVVNSCVVEYVSFSDPLAEDGELPAQAGAITADFVTDSSAIQNFINKGD